MLKSAMSGPSTTQGTPSLNVRAPFALRSSLLYLFMTIIIVFHLRSVLRPRAIAEETSAQIHHHLPRGFGRRAKRGRSQRRKRRIRGMSFSPRFTLEILNAVKYMDVGNKQCCKHFCYPASKGMRKDFLLLP